MSPGFEAPGVGFITGIKQADMAWLDNASSSGWITDSLQLNQQAANNYSQTYDGKFTLEPFKDFRVDLSFNRTYSKNHTETYKVQISPEQGELPEWKHLNPIDGGSLSLTYFTLGTMFESLSEETVSATFAQFENNRIIISDTNFLLKQVVSKHYDAPFVYEKVGTRYQYYLIDEFQDTSDMQWNNLFPLIYNVISSGFDSMIVC